MYGIKEQMPVITYLTQYVRNSRRTDACGHVLNPSMYVSQKDRGMNNFSETVRNVRLTQVPQQQTRKTDTQ